MQKYHTSINRRQQYMLIRFTDNGIVISKEIRRTLRIREGGPLLATLTPIDKFVGRYIVLRKEYQRSRITTAL